MQKLNFEPIPTEASKFILIGTPTNMHPNDKKNDELLENTKNDIEFLKDQFQKYYDTSSLIENTDQLKRNSKAPQRESSNLQSSTHQPSDRQKRSVTINESKNRLNTENNNNQNFIFAEKIPEYIFINKFYKTISKQKLIEYHKICLELSSIISRIMNFAQIHYEQKIPISIDRKKFFSYCSSFLQQKEKENPYHDISKKEEILENKLQRLSQFSKYKIINLDRLKSKLIELLNIGNEKEDQTTIKKKKKKEKIESENDNDNSNFNVIKKQSIYDPVLDYSPYSAIDDYLFYYIHSHQVNNMNNQFFDPPVIEIQKIALEITGITERNLSFKANNNSKEESPPNYTLFNNFLSQLLPLILEDKSMFDIIKEKDKDKEKRKKIYQHQIKTVITIAFTRIIFDTAYLFNYDYLLNNQADEKNHTYLHFNQEDEIIETNSKVIQNLIPSDLDIPDGFLIDYSMHKSHSQQNLQQQSNSNSESTDSNLPLSSSMNSSSFCTFASIKKSNKKIHELMEKEEDFIIMADKLSDLQFYSNPFDLSYFIYQIFNRIQMRLAKIAQMKSKKAKNVGKESGVVRSKSREFDPFVQFDDLFLFFLVVFTFNPPKNSRWIAAMLRRYTKLIPNMSMQQSASFFIAAVNYTISFPSKEEFSLELIERIMQIRDELKTQNS